MFFIKLTGDGERYCGPMYVRPETIESVSRARSLVDSKELTYVAVRSGYSVHVSESPEQVLALARLAGNQGHPAKQVVGVEDL